MNFKELNLKIPRAHPFCRMGQLVVKVLPGCALVLVVAPGRIAGRAKRPRLRSSAGTGHIHTSCVQVASADILSAAPPHPVALAWPGSAHSRSLLL
ncbi:hypothetical protein [Desulfofundulus australicus]|uniref:hypothetical protein n=1 Tax=Desulfofundulus australicus TaxID=1566 RepID=UPI0010426F8C|nr:hypothetical protein [Desulfofundulus australicus]